MTTARQPSRQCPHRRSRMKHVVHIHLGSRSISPAAHQRRSASFVRHGMCRWCNHVSYDVMSWSPQPRHNRGLQCLPSEAMFLAPDHGPLRLLPAWLQDLGVTQCWLPPPSQSVSRQGYLPCQLYDFNTPYGSEAQLRKLLSDLRAAGIAPLADIVINHRCADQQDQHGCWNIFTCAASALRTAPPATLCLLHTSAHSAGPRCLSTPHSPHTACWASSRRSALR